MEGCCEMLSSTHDTTVVVKLTAAMVTCIRSAQDQANQNFNRNKEASTLTEGLLVVDSCRGRKNKPLRV